MDSRELAASTLWWNGPKLLIDPEGSEEPNKFDEELPPEKCLSEMKAKDRKGGVGWIPLLSALTVDSELT